MSERMVTSREGINLYKEVGLSENTFYRHARERIIRKSLPDEKSERGALYSLRDIEKRVEYERTKKAKRIEALRKTNEIDGRTDWFNQSDLPYLLALDYEMYGVSESLDLTISYGWWSKNPYVCRILYNTKNRKDIWGYITLIPMEDATIFKLLRREMHERDIKPEHILTFEPGKSYNIYAASAVIRPEHRNYLRELIKSIFNYWCEQYPTIRLSKVYAYADSTEGWYLIKHLYFSPRRDVGEGAFELDPYEPNPSKLVTSFQDCLKSNGP